ncbi:hypothetical protein [Acinetobacter sp.]|uniref:hypothetical protein n=1 Tax=Acinetobacter sp. TaxID=472 RepID=UPI000C0B29E0|nr:hypothetical protein [Acinetobacter sp.]MAK31357.1 hypothetical protein [Acinetobacter sp.]|tara:strand:+ start:1469 stop:1753 length:285 start_codon:yes stop_codon:yes gene_type:complete
MRLENIKNPHIGAADAWTDFTFFIKDVEGGLDFVDFVEARVRTRQFFGAITVDINTENAFAEASWYVAANLLRSGEWPHITKNIDFAFLYAWLR